jgi:hypothetical protein
MPAYLEIRVVRKGEVRWRYFRSERNEWRNIPCSRIDFSERVEITPWSPTDHISLFFISCEASCKKYGLKDTCGESRHVHLSINIVKLRIGWAVLEKSKFYGKWKVQKELKKAKKQRFFVFPTQSLNSCTYLYIHYWSKPILHLILRRSRPNLIL